jgi:hypothetical protein
MRNASAARHPCKIGKARRRASALAAVPSTFNKVFLQRVALLTSHPVSIGRALSGKVIALSRCFQLIERAATALLAAVQLLPTFEELINRGIDRFRVG